MINNEISKVLSNVRKLEIDTDESIRILEEDRDNGNELDVLQIGRLSKLKLVKKASLNNIKPFMKIVDKASGSALKTFGSNKPVSDAVCRRL